MSDDTATKRMTLSHVLEMLLAKGAADHSSVTIARNAKGDTQFEVVVRTGDNSTVPDVLAAEAEAVAIYERLCERYPRSTPNGGLSVADEQAEIRKLSEERRELRGDNK